MPLKLARIDCTLLTVLGDDQCLDDAAIISQLESFITQCRTFDEELDYAVEGALATRLRIR